VRLRRDINVYLLFAIDPFVVGKFSLISPSFLRYRFKRIVADLIRTRCLANVGHREDGCVKVILDPAASS
jgi:hypothetical protein